MLCSLTGCIIQYLNTEQQFIAQVLNSPII